MHSFCSTYWWWLLRRVLQHWIGSAAGADQPVVVEVVDAALLVGRWDSRMQESWSVHLFHGRCAVRAMLRTALLAPRRTRRCRWVALRAAALRCEPLRCAASCELRRAARGWWPRVAREGWVTPRR